MIDMIWSRIRKEYEAETESEPQALTEFGTWGKIESEPEYRTESESIWYIE